ncbi:SLAP domain-containing protein [Virgibacillus halophilus]|uniref:SLAP domain-containing protein n=1 Tax=Tigheibacillus halophilus TaxID=361280 RepID=A0ABU5C963_9BACI|nr:SLAP domain-containing protein [Virgibacillus halophilus]
MKQKLQFEPAWDKTISKRDRREIEQTFDSLISLPKSGIHFSLLRQAKNYQNSLLLTVLIHNRNSEPFVFDNPVLQYRMDDLIFARHAFVFSYTIPKKTSLPWTFIFPAGTYTEQATRLQGKLEIAARLA